MQYKFQHLTEKKKKRAFPLGKTLSKQFGAFCDLMLNPSGIASVYVGVIELVG